MHWASLAAALLLACEQPPETFAEVLPDEQLLLNETELYPSGLPDPPSEWAAWLLEQAQLTNLRHADLVLLVEAVTVLPPYHPNPRDLQTVVWGPWIIDSTAEQLRVEATSADRYTWVIETQEVDPKDVRFDDDAWLPELAGTIDVDPTGAPIGGEFTIDLDEVGFGIVAEILGSVDESSNPETDDDLFAVEAPSGQAAVRYAYRGDELTLTTFPDLEDGTTTVPDDGGITFVATAGEGGTAEARFDEDRDGDGTPESYSVFVQWMANQGGRADVIRTGPQGQTTTSVECWNADHARTWFTDGAASEGDRSTCTFDEQ